MESWKVWPCDIAALTLTDLHFFKRRWREKKNQLKIGTVTEQSNYLLKESPSPQVLWAMSEPPISVKDWMKCSLFEYDVSSFSRYEFPSKSFSLAAMNFPANISHGPRLAYGIGAGYASVRHSQLVGSVYNSDLLSWLSSIDGVGLGYEWCLSSAGDHYGILCPETSSTFSNKRIPGPEKNVVCMNERCDERLLWIAPYPTELSQWERLSMMLPWTWSHGLFSCHTTLKPGLFFLY